jgi:ATP-dependent DNA helicase RecQ
LYFGDKIDECTDKCGSCTKEPVQQIDITKEAQMFLSTVYRLGQKFGQNHVIDVLRGSKAKKLLDFNHDRLSVYGVGEGRNKNEWGMIADRLFEKELIYIGEYRAITLTSGSKEILSGGGEVWIDEDKIGNIAQVQELDDDLEPEDELFESFRVLRREIATKNDIPAYIVFSDKTLKDLSLKLPQTKEQMLDVHGVGEVKYERYGREFLELSKKLQKESS